MFPFPRRRYRISLSESQGIFIHILLVECLQNQKKKSAIFRVESSPEMIPSSGEIEFPKEPQHFGRGTSILAKPDCTALKETSNFYKNIVTTTSSSTLVNLAMASQEGLTAPPRVTSATEVSVIGKAKPSISSEFDNSKASTNATLNSGLISADPSKTVVSVKRFLIQN